MELIENIRPVKLRNVQQLFQCPFLSKIETSTSIHFIEQYQKIAHVLIAQLIIDHYEKESGSGITILVDLTYSWNTNNKCYRIIEQRLKSLNKSSHLIIVRNINNFTDLLRLLKSIQDTTYFKNKPELLDFPISSIFIDNISVFYWECLISENIEQEYNGLASILMKLKSFYGSSIITTSWDKDFDQSPLNTFKSAKPDVLNYCNLPMKYLCSFRHVYFLKKVLNNRTHEEVIIGKYFPSGGDDNSFDIHDDKLLQKHKLEYLIK
ncbi:hypothetical protein WICMUC_000870 [Wickerhamomyces mucosus]|uniref:Uncharacterized protein n=1 Tax=Wickerhamomyces mucosus TaxID=1378264 RepID=A0A9P8THC8_9ASCO|nr:hypothetical protein WICMUC_000870 [Wickerhamomyces mucosus]